MIIYHLMNISNHWCRKSFYTTGISCIYASLNRNDDLVQNYQTCHKHMVDTWVLHRAINIILYKFRSISSSGRPIRIFVTNPIQAENICCKILSLLEFLFNEVSSPDARLKFIKMVWYNETRTFIIMHAIETRLCQNYHPTVQKNILKNDEFTSMG